MVPQASKGIKHQEGAKHSLLFFQKYLVAFATEAIRTM